MSSIFTFALQISDYLLWSWKNLGLEMEYFALIYWKVVST